jgi:hypothetical protein
LPRWYDKTAPSEFPVPEFGAHDLEPSFNQAVWDAKPIVRTVKA